MMAQWLGCAFFKTGGQVSWRVPLAIQTVFPFALFCILFYMPESPRWCRCSLLPISTRPLLIPTPVYAHGRSEEAKEVMVKLHRDKEDSTNSFALQEFKIMTAQIDMELENRMGTWQALKIPSMRKRFLLGFVAMMGTQCSGLVVLLSKPFCPLRAANNF